MSKPFDFASMMESGTALDASRTGRRLRPGEVVEGTVVQIGRDSVFVDVGATVEGRIERAELEDRSGGVTVALGDIIRASVVSNNDVTGPILSITLGKGQKGKLDTTALQSARESGLPVEGTVGAVRKGGVEVSIGAIRAFCPASQVDVGFVKDLQPLVGQTLQFIVLEVKDEGRSVIVSRRALLEKERRQTGQAIVAQLAVGSEYQGKVASLQKYGAFIELGGGVEGLVHISEISHTRTDRVEDILSVGEVVNVKVLAIDPSDKGPYPRLRLSMKALTEAPQAPSLDAGEVLEGTVSKLGNSGIFVETQKGTGMVPLRELGLPRGADHRRAFPVGTAVRVVLLNRDASGRIAFSISRVASVEERQNYREFTTSSRQTADQPGAMGTFGQLLRQKLNLPEPAPQLKSSTDTDVSANARDPATEQAATTATAAVNSPTREHGLPVPAPQQPAPAVQARNSNPLGPTRPTPEGVIRRKRQGSDG